jgi:hypothetical protein
MRKIVVKINKGQVTVTPEGFKGESCKNATAALEKALGKVVSDTPTSEMYEEQNQEFLGQGE